MVNVICELSYWLSPMWITS